MYKICVITSTRADYGIMKNLIKKIDADDMLDLQLVVTGMHLSSEYGNTYQEIDEDGIKITERIEILLSADSDIGTAKTMGLALISFSEVLKRLAPQVVIVLGDRYEIFACASVCNILGIPLVHIHGGETTEGAFDEGFRHSITKMSYIHFAACELYRKRVIQLGEAPERVYNVGALADENIRNIGLLSRKEIEESIGFLINNHTFLCTYHPVTLDKLTAMEQIENIIEVIERNKEMRVIFTKANSDKEGRLINQRIEAFVMRNPERTVVFASLGLLRYLSAMKYVRAIIGNSSSGILEAPSLKTPTINIGDRQKGRVIAETIINCSNCVEDIEEAIEKINSREYKRKLELSTSPFCGGDTSDRIIDIIKEHINKGMELKKKFYDIRW